MSWRRPIFGIIQGTVIGVIKGDTRSLDYSSYKPIYKPFVLVMLGRSWQDFKPHNILLASPLRPGQPDVVKLVDFGLSKAGPCPKLKLI